jgi:outer membrane protein TolC
VIDEALMDNPELASFRNAAEAQRFVADSAMSTLLPSVDGSARMVTIDPDRAESVGSPDQVEGAVGARVEQVLWSEQAWTNLRVQRLLSEAQDLLLLARRSDTALQTAEAYYDLVRATGLVRIRREAVERTQGNLDKARLQERIGEESLADVYRFESQLAQDNQALIDAITQVRRAALALDSARGGHSAEPMMARSFSSPAASEVGFSFEEMERLTEQVNTIRGVFYLEQFAVDAGLARSETLAASDISITVRERERQSAQRRFFSPTISLFVDVEHTFYEGGEGGASFSDADDTDWSAGVIVSIPIYAGQQRLAQLRQTNSNLEQAQNDRTATALAIEEYARISAASLVAAYNKLQQSRTAERAAGQGLELAEDAYARGFATSLELLDAQNNAAVAYQQTGTVQAEFQIAWARLLYVTGWIDALVSNERAEEFVTAVRKALED